MGIFDEIESEIRLEKMADSFPETRQKHQAFDEDFEIDLELEQRVSENLERIKQLNRRVDSLISNCNIHIKVEQYESYDQFIVREDFNKIDDEEFYNLMESDVETEFAGYRICIMVGDRSRTFRRIYHHNDINDVYSSESFSKILSQYLSSLSR